MEESLPLITIVITAFAGSALTFFSGFGLGTILTPVFALFFPIELAIALTAIVHFLNNIFKLFLIGQHAHLPTVLRFGIPSMLAAFLGAWLLSFLSNGQPLLSYTLQNKIFEITVVKLVIALLLIFFVLFDLVPRLASLSFNKKYLIPGGLLSGFFGGLSGNQGALRSAFLIKSGLSKEAFIGTGVLVACLVDMARITVYAGSISDVASEISYDLLTAATLSAFAGAFIGSKLIKKITIRNLQIIVGVMLLIFAILLASGLI
jgi:uncharacterized protein